MTSWRRVHRIIEHNSSAPHGGVLRTHRGPSPRQGRGPGAPSTAIVEEVPCLWVGWFTDAARRLGWALPLHVTVAGLALRMSAVELRFGTRWYWRCPLCDRRCEAVYMLGARVGCRQCLRLAYKSQSQRPTSVYAWMELIFAREALGARRRDREADVPATLAEQLREDLAQRVAALFETVRVEHGETNNGAGTDPGTGPADAAGADPGATGGPV